MAERSGGIRVEVVVARIGQAWSRSLVLDAGATVADAVALSGLAAVCAEVSVTADCLGIFGRRVLPTHVLRDGDRVEIYRPLQLDPMDARRRRARS
ncbi:MAG TPA: RnfH family protein [Rhodanobacteraceae bacterium]